MAQAKRITAKNVDDYIATFPENVQRTLETLRETIKSTVKDAEEVINYQIPCYKYKGNLVSFAAFDNHCSFYPMSRSIVEKFKDELRSYKNSTGTIRFPLNKPIPVTLIKKLVLLRMKENQEMKEKKSVKKTIRENRIITKRNLANKGNNNETYYLKFSESN